MPPPDTGPCPWADFPAFRAAARAANPIPAIEQVPADLAGRQQWLIWRYEPGETAEKKPRKMPYWPAGPRRRVGEQGGELDRSRLTDFAHAAAVAKGCGYDGVGFAFLPGDGLIGIDLDGMIDPETGAISDRCASIIGACASYTEYSPSGKGVHIICTGDATTIKSNAIGVELFVGRQYFTFTGRAWPGAPASVNPLDAAVVRRIEATIRTARQASAPGAPPGADSPPTASPPLEQFGGRQRSRAETVALAEEALAFISPHDYESWIAVGMACKAGLGSAGFMVWDEWSARSEKYAGADDTHKRWHGFRPDRITLGSLFKLAEDGGWVPPRVKARERKPREKATRHPSDSPAHPPARAKAPAGGGARPSNSEGLPDDSPPPPPDPPGSDSDADEDGSWQRALIRKRGEISTCLANVELVLSRMPQWRGLIGYDEFAERTVFRRPLPFETDGQATGEWSDHHDVMTAIWLQRAYHVEFAPGTVGQAVEAVSRKHRFHPVRDALLSLPPWDGIRRLPEWLTDYLGVARTEYSAAVGTYFVRAMIFRVMRPGWKFDYCPVLEGAQGVGKSSVARILAWHWFADTDLDLANKDALLALPGHWVYEIPELGGLMKAEERRQKSFLSRQEDEFRPPYGKRLIKVPRQNVFIGTTNEDEYLKDPTGGRRFWPVACGSEFHMDGLLAMREQLFAEALADYHAGARCWPDRDEQRRLFDPQQARRGMQEPLEDLLSAWVDAQTAPFAMADAACDGLKLTADKLTPAIVTRLGIVLTRLGCVRKENRRAADPTRRRLYLSPAMAKMPIWSVSEDVGPVGGGNEPF